MCKQYVVISRRHDDVSRDSDRYFTREDPFQGDMWGGALMSDCAKKMSREEANELVERLSEKHSASRKLLVYPAELA